MQKSILFLKQSLLLFAFLSISLAVYAQGTNTGTTKPSDPKKDLVFSGNQTTTPLYPGGEDAMNQFIEDNLIYPESALKDNVSGRVFVRFLVDTTGMPTNVHIQQGLTPDCNLAAMEVVKKMPAWIPATRDRKKTTGFVTVPVIFKTKQVVYEYEATETEMDYEPYRIEGKKWSLVEIPGKELPSNLANVPYFTLTQNEKKRKILNGNESCADFTGLYSWNQKNWSLKFTVKEVAKKKCKSKKVKVISGEFLSILKQSSQYRIKDRKLQIGKMVKENFTPLAVFQYEIIKDKEKGKKK